MCIVVWYLLDEYVTTIIDKSRECRFAIRCYAYLILMRPYLDTDQCDEYIKGRVELCKNSRLCLLSIFYSFVTTLGIDIAA